MEQKDEKTLGNTGTSNKKNIGVKVDERIWRQFRALAISQGKTAGDLLDELMAEYVSKSRMQS